MDGKSQEAAAAAAGMRVRPARAWEQGPLPSQAKKRRNWRTRKDPFEAVWKSDIEPLLVRDDDRVLEGPTILELLEQRHPGQFGAGQLRTLQRRIRDWRAVHGPDREVFFEQVHPPGREAQIDFTHATELGVTIAGALFPHLLFEFVLSFSGWRWVCLASGETYEALMDGVQGALWGLGGAPEVIRSDNLSAATHELKRSGGRALTERFALLLGLSVLKINPVCQTASGTSPTRLPSTQIDCEARRLGAAQLLLRLAMDEARLFCLLANLGCSCGPDPRCSNGRSP